MPATAAAAPAQAPEPPEAAPAKPKHKIGQLTTGELAQERSRLEAALRRPFSADLRALLQARLSAVLAEQDDRRRNARQVQPPPRPSSRPRPPSRQPVPPAASAEG